MLKMLKPLALSACLIVPALGPAQALDLNAMSEAERAAFGEQVRAYLLENPEVIFEAIEILEERRGAQASAADRDLVAQNADAIFNDGFSYVTGNPDGDLTIVEFLDYRCGFCKRAHPVVEELLDRDPNLRLVVKEFPILGPSSVSAGRMALAALDVDRSKFSSLNDALMTYQGDLSSDAAYRVAGEVGYDIAKLKEVAESDVVDQRLQTNYQLAQALGLEGTPAFVIGKQVIRGFLPVEDMLEVIAQERSAQD